MSDTINVTEHLKKLSEIANWFENQEQVDVEAGLVKVKPHLSEIIKFRRMNLMDDRFPIKAPLDLIFCRNVMIYFDRPTQERLVNKFYHHLKPGGYLFIGHSESLQWVSHPFKTIAPTIYWKEA